LVKKRSLFLTAEEKILIKNQPDDLLSNRVFLPEQKKFIFDSMDEVLPCLKK